MQYYVIGPDGNRYGPGDIQMLRQWAAENRVTPETMLEDFSTGQRYPAAAVPGLFGAPTTYAPGPAESPYQMPPNPGQIYPRGYAVDNGSKELTTSFIWTALGFVCCPILCPAVGLHYGNLAARKGNPSAQGARIFAIVMLCLQSVGVLFYIIAIIVAIASGTPPDRL